MGGKGSGPAGYPNKVIECVLEELAEGKTLSDICAQADYPSYQTVMRWVYDDVDGFYERYTKAREIGIHAIIDETIKISDDSSGDAKLNAQGDTVMDGEFVARSRLRVDTRKWLASKIVPKIYGDKVQQEVTGKDGGPVSVSWMPTPPAQ